MADINDPIFAGLCDDCLDDKEFTPLSYLSAPEHDSLPSLDWDDVLNYNLTTPEAQGSQDEAHREEIERLRNECSRLQR